MLTMGALIIGTIGLFFLSTATSGVGIICFACLVSIIARIKQADANHTQTLEVLKSINRKMYELYPDELATGDTVNTTHQTRIPWYRLL